MFWRFRFARQLGAVALLGIKGDVVKKGLFPDSEPVWASWRDEYIRESRPSPVRTAIAQWMIETARTPDEFRRTEVLLRGDATHLVQLHLVRWLEKLKQEHTAEEVSFFADALINGWRDGTDDPEINVVIVNLWARNVLYLCKAALEDVTSPTPIDVLRQMEKAIMILWQNFVPHPGFGLSKLHGEVVELFARRPHTIYEEPRLLTRSQAA